MFRRIKVKFQCLEDEVTIPIKKGKLLFYPQSINKSSYELVLTCPCVPDLIGIVSKK